MLNKKNASEILLKKKTLKADFKTLNLLYQKLTKKKDINPINSHINKNNIKLFDITNKIIINTNKFIKKKSLYILASNLK